MLIGYHTLYCNYDYAGLAPTWRTIKLLWENRFFRYCSRADFFALAVTEAIDYTAQRAEQEGSEFINLDLSPLQ